MAEAAATAPSAEVALCHRLLARHPADAAVLLERADPDEVVALLSEHTGAPTVLQHMSADLAAGVLARLRTDRASQVIEALAPRQAAALLPRLADDDRARLLSALPRALASDLSDLMAYPPDSAGGLMSPQVTAFPPGATVGDVLQRLRGSAGRRVQDVFLVDAEGRLIGGAPLEVVVTAPPDRRLDTIATLPAAGIPATASKEEVVEELDRRPGASLPVVDFDGHLVGVLRQAHLLDAVEDDAAGDALAMVGAGREERALSSPLLSVRKRLPWLQINLLTAFLAASVVAVFEDTIARNTALAVLLPVVAGQSGNTGAQALAVTMRGLALREVRVRQWLRVSAKETAAGALNGLAVALTTALGVWAWSRSTGLALVIGSSMVISMTLAGLSGALVPMALTAARQDPAQASSIVLTTVTDVVGFFSFLGIATLLSSML